MIYKTLEWDSLLSTLCQNWTKLFSWKSIAQRLPRDWLTRVSATRCFLCWSIQKEPKIASFSKNVPNSPYFWCPIIKSIFLWIQILHIKNERNLPSYITSPIFFNHIEFRTMPLGHETVYKKSPTVDDKTSLPEKKENIKQNWLTHRTCLTCYIRSPHGLVCFLTSPFELWKKDPNIILKNIKDKSPEVPFHRITSSFNYFEFYETELREIYLNQNGCR